MANLRIVFQLSTVCSKSGGVSRVLYCVKQGIRIAEKDCLAPSTLRSLSGSSDSSCLEFAIIFLYKALEAIKLDSYCYISLLLHVHLNLQPQFLP